MQEEDPACAVAHSEVPSADAIAHGDAPAPVDGRTVVAVFSSPVARSLLRFARETGFRTVLYEPRKGRKKQSARPQQTDPGIARFECTAQHMSLHASVNLHDRPFLARRRHSIKVSVFFGPKVIPEHPNLIGVGACPLPRLGPSKKAPLSRPRPP
jgi:hypothetical protein